MKHQQSNEMVCPSKRLLKTPAQGPTSSPSASHAQYPTPPPPPKEQTCPTQSTKVATIPSNTHMKLSNSTHAKSLHSTQNPLNIRHVKNDQGVYRNGHGARSRR